LACVLLSFPALADRILYKALVAMISDSLPGLSRSDINRQLHVDFGLQGNGYVAEVDIVSCYEYIDHAILFEELVTQSLAVEFPRLIQEYLTETHGRPLGLPQMSAESHLLADTYLDKMSRALRREGFELSRYADDFRILTATFAHSGNAIARSSLHARQLGLALSAEKTKLYKTATLVARKEREEEAFYFYFDEGSDIDEEFVSVGPYGTFDEEDEGGDAASDAEVDGYFQLIQSWIEAVITRRDRKTADLLQGHIARGLSILRGNDEPLLSDGQLRQIVYADPGNIEPVARYIAHRAENFSEDQWPVLCQLTALRQTSWSRLWILHAARAIQTSVTDEHASVLSWASQQCFDESELVRAEALWTLATFDEIDDHDLAMSSYQRASLLTQPLLAAVISKCVKANSAEFRAVYGDSPLNKEAIAWAKNQ
jgi:RNA-directed DNA polymerase